MSEAAPIVVIGAGLAGAACLHALAEAGLGPLLCVERQQRPGSQASDQNAGLIRSHAANPFTAALARAGARWWGQQTLAPFNRCGSIIIGGRSAELVAGFRRHDHRWLNAQDLEALIGHRPVGDIRAFLNPLDGVAAPDALIAAMLDDAVQQGAELRTGCEARLDSGHLLLDDEPTEYAALVIAAGAWSASLLPLPVLAFSRHLFSCAGAQINEDAPWVWDLDEEFYFRRDGALALLCACDETVVHAPDPEHWPTPEPSLDALLLAKAKRRWPGLGPLRILDSWAGLRTITPDDGFVLGADPRRKNIYWCTGLGGHGVTAAVPAARLALAALTGADLNASDHRLAAAHSPSRFAILEETWHG
jgi:glycine/D-amino acid oxidase-like deaminating enzyme